MISKIFGNKIQIFFKYLNIFFLFFEFKFRCTIDLSANTIKHESWGNEADIPYINQFDFPMINPEYEGKKYNYAYGQAIVEFERQYLIKKDIADSANDKVHIIPKLNIDPDNH